MTTNKPGQMTDGEIKRELSAESTDDDRRKALQAEMADRAKMRTSGDIWYPGKLV